MIYSHDHSCTFGLAKCVCDSSMPSTDSFFSSMPTTVSGSVIILFTWLLGWSLLTGTSSRTSAKLVSTVSCPLAEEFSSDEFSGLSNFSFGSCKEEFSSVVWGVAVLDCGGGATTLGRFDSWGELSDGVLAARTVSNFQYVKSSSSSSSSWSALLNNKTVLV